MKAGILLAVILLPAGTAVGVDRLGPPVAAGKSAGLGVEYSFFRFDPFKTERAGETGDVRISKAAVFAQAGLGKNLDIFARAGEAWVDAGKNLSYPRNYLDLIDEGRGFALGAGLKATFYRRNRLSLGAIFQGGYENLDFSEGSLVIPSFAATVSSQMRNWFVEAAAGPDYELIRNRLFVFGGPLAGYMRSDFDADIMVNGCPYKAGEDKGEFFAGLYGGVEGKALANVSLGIEGQLTNEFWGIACDVLIAFK